jgi:glycosyltransferase involved in cell wall biosynthesis
MNILLINHYAGSPELGMEFRPYYMAKEWLSQGNTVKIVGATYSHLRKKQPLAGEQNIDGVDYYWIKCNRYKGNGIGRVLSMFIFVFKIFLKYKSLIKTGKPDVVIASSTYPLDNIIARYISRKTGAKYLYEVHDLWPLSPVELGGMSKKHPFVKLMQWAENYAYKHCDAVVSMLPCALEHMMEHGLSKEKFYCVPNGIVKADWDSVDKLPEEHFQLIQTLKKDRFLVGFAGAHGIANSLEAVIDAVSTLKDENISLILVGTGQEKDNLISYVKEKQISNVFFLPPITKYQIPSFLKEMDVLYIGLQRQSLFRFGISPNKIFDYMMAGKPIIQAIDAGNNIVKDAQCGIYVEPDNSDAIADAILKLKKSDKRLLEEYGNNGHEYVLKYHAYDVLSKRFLDIIKSL